MARILAVRGTRLEDTGSIWLFSVALSLLMGMAMSCHWRRCCRKAVGRDHI